MKLSLCFRKDSGRGGYGDLMLTLTGVISLPKAPPFGGTFISFKNPVSLFESLNPEASTRNQQKEQVHKSHMGGR